MELNLLNFASKKWAQWTVPEFLFEEGGLIPALQQLLVSVHDMP